MNTQTFRPLLVAACTLVLLASGQFAFAQPSITYRPDLNLIDTTDYSGLTVDGYWFANFDTANLETGQPVGQNAVNALPSWAQQLNNTFDPDPNTSMYSWDDELVVQTGMLVNAAESIGGNTAFNTLTLPDGTTGLSGQAITTFEAGQTGQSRNLLSDLVLGPGTPSSFLLYVVVDNEDANTGTGVRRVKARIDDDPDLGVPPDTEADTSNGIDGTRNNIADVYAFRYDNMTDGMQMRIQLRNTNSPINDDASTILGAGMAGFMLVNIPEPATASLLMLGALGLCSVRRRR